MHFDATITLGNVVTFFSLAIAAVAFWVRQDERVHTIQKWIDGHEHEAEGREKLINEMGLAIVELRTLVRIAREENDF